MSKPEIIANYTRDILTSMIESNTFNKKNMQTDEQVADSIGKCFDILAKSIEKTLVDVK